MIQDNLLIIVVIVVAVVLVLSFKLSTTREKRKVHKNNRYAYEAKRLPMTVTELEFFRTLEETVRERYYVFPQVHLSTVLNPTSAGSDRTYAFRHIDGKSVDYVLCDRETLAPTYAIELDDYTHDRRDRKKRDAEVRRIFAEAQLPLVRFSDKNVSSAQIIQALTKARL